MGTDIAREGRKWLTGDDRNLRHSGKSVQQASSKVGSRALSITKIFI